MSQRSSAVKRRAATVFEGRQRLTTDEFSELFPDNVRSIATRFRDILKGVLIVDAQFIQPYDHLVTDLGTYDVDFTSARVSPTAPQHGYRVVTARSFHAGGVNALLLDGSVRFVSSSISRDA